MFAPDQRSHDRSFPPTAWTVLLAARDPSSATAREAREAVCKAYWQPVCSYLKTLGMDAGYAEDLTQSILANFCTDGWIETVDRAQGRLRHFFKAAARNALANHFRDQSRQKRGGGVGVLSTDQLHDDQAPVSDMATDEAFDQHWAWTLFQRSMTALAESYASRGKGELFAALKPALISPDEMQPSVQIGSQFGVGEQQIRIEVHRLRRRMADRLRAEVAATLGPAATSAEIDAELRYLVQSLAHERTS
ncbi:MAG: sigma-70 family RNA polymerase sigma factor [Verrucomicrobiaceae bacterium]|nr:sigma-70 family RNA polymerase sigma factor [Verrucomicrobiaceae bacterium]